MGYISAFLGCEYMISTNSCGSIYPNLSIGDFIVQSDHFNHSHRKFINSTLLDSKLRAPDQENYLFSATNIH